MNAAKRQKRDTAENLYKQCMITGNCPTDVVNKIENRTWADVLLQAFSSIIFLGNLGIGTGKGSAGVGIRPIPGGGGIPETIAPTTVPTRPTIPRPSVTRPSRPFSVPLDTLSIGSRPVDPTGIKPIDVIDPTSPAIVTLTDTLPDTVITVGEGTIPDLEVVTDTTSIHGHPTVFQASDNELAILNVTPADPPPTKVVFATEITNPVFESTAGHIDSSVDVFVNPFATTETITFGEKIPLEPINPRSEFDIEDIPKTSTPMDTFNKYYNRAQQFYRRHIQQVPTRNPNLFGDVSRAIQFGFENPAFDPEVSIQFEQDVNDVTAAPDSDFAGIRKISRPVLTATSSGTVRVSRLGSRAGVRTRSGLTAGQDVHYYYDFSTIEHIELPTISTNTSSTIIEPSTQETILQPSVVSSTIFNEEELLDSYNETFHNLHLEVPGEDSPDENIVIPIYNSFSAKPIIVSIGDGTFYSAHNTSAGQNILPNTPLYPIPKDILVEVYSDDFILDPSLFTKRKRKRSDSF